MRKIYLCYLLAAVCTSPLAAQCLSGVYTINSAVPTGGTNFQTFTAAVAATQNACGISGPVVFNVVAGSGPYNEQIIIPPITGASAVNTVTFNGNGNTLQATPVTGNRHLIRLNGADHIKINNLTLMSLSNSFGWGIHLTNGADHNKIANCIIDLSGTTTTTANNSAGIVVSGSNTSVTTDGSASYDTVLNNIITGAYRGIAMNGDNNSQDVEGNVISGNTIRDFYTNGIELTNTDGIIISNNDISRANRTGVGAFVGIELGADCINSLVIGNRIHDTHNTATTQSGNAFGISLDGADATVTTRNRIINNQIYNFNSTTGDQYGINSDGSNFATFLHNTIVLDHAGSTSGVTRGIFQDLNVDSNIFKNNIVHVSRGGSGAKHCIYIDNANSEVASNHNDLYLNATNGNIGLHGSTSYATLTAWKTANGGVFDQQSESLNPQFQNVALANFTPTNPLLDNKGAALGITTDIAGGPRSLTTPDMGSLEFGITPPATCTAPTGLAAAGATTTSANLSWTAVAGAAGYEYVIDQNAGNPAGAGTPIAGTTYGATGLSSGATYYLHVRTQCGPSLFSAWVTIPFTTCPAASVTASGPLTGCQGSGLTLTANSGTGFTYQWQLNGSNITGATTASHSPAASGSYTVVVSFGGCATTSAGSAVTINSAPAATITPGGPLGFCQGSNVTLQANTGTGLTYQWKLNGTNIAGATAAAYTAAATGSYTVVVTAGGCSTTSAGAAVTASPVPATTVTASGATTICQGNSVVLAVPSGSGNTYQWALNGNNITGATAASYTATTAGSYIVTVTNGGCTIASAASNVTVNPTPPAVITAGGPLTFCQGDQVMLNANTGPGLSWQWRLNGVDIAGATGSSHHAAAGGSYTVVVTNAGQCSATAAPVTVTVNAGPSGTITWSSPLSFCEGGGVVLSTPMAAGFTYQWMRNGNPVPGATAPSYIAGQSGSYTVQLNTTSGCSGTLPPVTVQEHPLPAPVITRNNLVLSTGIFSSYQWFHNHLPVAGATAPSYTVTSDGSYAVAVTNAEGCSQLSTPVYVGAVGVGTTPAATATIRIYPNPARDFVTIEQTGPARMTGVSVTNALGARVFESVAEQNSITIPVSGLAAGVYMICIRSGEHAVVRKLDILR